MEEKTDIFQILGNNIKRIRLLRGFTQQAFAEKLNKSVNFVSLVERGESGISIQTIIDICKVLKVDTNDIFTGIVTPTNADDVDSFIVDSLKLFGDEDKAMVSDLITYIINSKK